MQVPHSQLSPGALRAVVEEFVTRDGTDHSSVEGRVAAVLRQLKCGEAVLHFDEHTKTCNVTLMGNNADPFDEPLDARAN